MAFIGRFFRIALGFFELRGEPFFELRGEPLILTLCGEIGNMGTGLPPGKPGLRCTSWVSCTGLGLITGLITDQPPAPDLGLDLADLALRLDIGLAYWLMMLQGARSSGAVAQGQLNLR